jgi:hypothetical protein
VFEFVIRPHAVTSEQQTVLAHGLGGSTDLPVPLGYALVGAAWALTFTFAIVALAWRKPRFDPAKPGAFYVLLWVGLVAVSLAVGPIWRVLSPMRTLYRITLSPWRFRGLPYPARLGYYPAAFGLFAFVWLELASPDPGSLTAIKMWLLVYALMLAGGAAVWGDRWFARADPFEVYSVVASRLSPFRRSPETRRVVVVGNPFDHCRRCLSGRAPSPCSRCCSAPRPSTVSRRRPDGETSSTTLRTARRSAPHWSARAGDCCSQRLSQ